MEITQFLQNKISSTRQHELQVPSNNLKKWNQFNYFQASNGIWNKSQQTPPWTKFYGVDEHGEIDLVMTRKILNINEEHPSRKCSKSR